MNRVGWLLIIRKLIVGLPHRNGSVVYTFRVSERSLLSPLFLRNVVLHWLIGGFRDTLLIFKSIEKLLK
jgi:hypothetical protein